MLVQRRGTGKGENNPPVYYAMKRMQKLQYSGGMTRFVLTEKEILRKVSHRFIQCLFYAFQTYESLYLVFDFCPGGDVRSIIN